MRTVSATTAATKFTMDSAASENKPTEPVIRQATIFNTMVITAAAMDSHAYFVSVRRLNCWSISPD